MEGANRRERPHREWLDNITEWGKVSLQELSQADGQKSWKSLVKIVLVTYEGAQPTVLNNNNNNNIDNL